MDLIPIQPHRSELIKPTVATANDGGSKSQSGYIKRAVKNDEVKISDEIKRLIGEDPVIEEKNFAGIIKEFILSLFRRIKSVLNFKFPEKKPEPVKAEKKDFLSCTKHADE